MSTFTSPTPALDLNLQNLANAATLIQGVAYIHSSGESDSQTSDSDPRLRRGWKKLGEVSLALDTHQDVIASSELDDFLAQLESLEKEGHKLEGILQKPDSFWRKISYIFLVGSKATQERLKKFEDEANKLDIHVTRSSTKWIRIRLQEKSARASGSGGDETTPMIMRSPGLADAPRSEPAVTTATDPSSSSSGPPDLSRRNPFQDPPEDILDGLEPHDGETIVLVTFPRASSSAQPPPNS